MKEAKFYPELPEGYAVKQALIALLAPFTVFGIAFLVGMLVTDGLISPAFPILFGSHIGGCVGDLFDTFLLLFKYRHCAVLVRDTGPEQTFYVKG